MYYFIPIHPSIHPSINRLIAYPGVSHSGSRLRKVSHTSFSLAFSFLQFLLGNPKTFSKWVCFSFVSAILFFITHNS